MKTASCKTMVMVLPQDRDIRHGVVSVRAFFLLLLMGLWFLGTQTPCQGEESATGLLESESVNQKLEYSLNDRIPQWSWEWVDEIRENSANLFPVPVSLNPKMSLGQPTPMGSSYHLLTQESGVGEHRSLFSILDDGEALLELLDRSGKEFGPGLENMLADTLNTSFLSMGSRLEFHMGKRFLPYLGGGIIYSGKDCGNTFLEGMPSATGWELGVGFAFSEAPLRFGVDVLYRGFNMQQEDRGIAMRMDESCPNSFDQDTVSLSAGFTVRY